MKKIWVFFILLIITSCMSNESAPATRENVKTRNGYIDFDALEKLKRNDSFGSLIEKKFKEFYDLNVLLQEYPDFKNDIEKRIENFTTGKRKIFEINDSIKVVNIRQKGAFVKVSDSLEMTHVLFDVITDTEIKTDSVIAFITKKDVEIDGKKVTSKKVKFTRVVIQKFE